MINWQLLKQGIRWPVSPGRIAGSGVDPSRSSTFLKLSADKLLVSKWSQAQVYYFFKFTWNMLCLCHYGPALLRFWFQTVLGRENSTSFFKKTCGEDLFLPWSALVTLYVQCVCSDWSKFDRWVHAENLCSILKVVYFDGWSWQSFVSTCKVSNYIFLVVIVSSLSCNLNRCAVRFQSFMNIACRSYLKIARVSNVFRLHIVIKPLNKK